MISKTLVRASGSFPPASNKVCRSSASFFQCSKLPNTRLVRSSTEKRSGILRLFQTHVGNHGFHIGGHCAAFGVKQRRTGAGQLRSPFPLHVPATLESFGKGNGEPTFILQVQQGNKHKHQCHNHANRYDEEIVNAQEWRIKKRCESRERNKTQGRNNADEIQ